MTLFFKLILAAVFTMSIGVTISGCDSGGDDGDGNSTGSACAYEEDYDGGISWACQEDLTQSECEDEGADYFPTSCRAAGYPVECDGFFAPDGHDCDLFY